MASLPFLLGFVALMVLAGALAAPALWSLDESRGDEPTPIELALTALLLGMGLTQAIAYALTLVGLLRPVPLATAAFVVAVPTLRAARARLRRVDLRRTIVPTTDMALAVAALFPMAVWLVYAFWRGHVFFVLNHDGLSYHMPRALLMARTGHFGPFVSSDSRLTWPASYELLMSLTMVLTGTDRYTAWVGTASYATFLLAVAAMASRWWGMGLRVLVPVFVLAAMPIALLHASAHKNDLLMATVTIALIHFVSRWAARPQVASLALAILAGGMTLGTKITGFFVGPGALLVFALGVVRARREHWTPNKPGVRVLVASLAMAALVGASNYVFNLVELGRAIVPAEGRNDGSWGQLSSIWQFFYLALARPFSRSQDSVYVPWTHEHWHLSENDIFFSTWGAACSWAALALPVVAVLLLRARLPGARERLCATFIAVLSSAALVAIHETPPHGFFLTWVRCVLVFPMVLALWSYGGTLAVAERYPWGKLVERVSLLAAVWLFSSNALHFARIDGCGPFEDFVRVLAHPEEDRTVWAFPRRAGSVVDILAGPDDHIAVDGAFDAWIYPAYGRDRTREVSVLRHGSGPVPIPADVDWVIVDRSWSCFFGNPNFRTLGDWPRYIGRGAPLPEDVVVLNQLRGDPRFRLVYYLKVANQAVFARVDSKSPAVQALLASMPSGPT
jgi:hypothetical protein